MTRRTQWRNCALCGEFKITTREHVVPRSLYPASKAASKFQRITIGACAECNNGTADDDAHFRTVVALAGPHNDIVDELWKGPIARALAQVDGRRRARDVFKIMRPAPDAGLDQYRIFPAEDDRVLRIIRKIIRGLSHHHGLGSALKDGQVFADVMRYAVPEDVIAAMSHFAAEPDVLQYGVLSLTSQPGVASVWLLRFFRRTSFVGFVYESEEVVRQPAQPHIEPMGS